MTVLSKGCSVLIALLVTLLTSDAYAQSREQIRVTGSSSVFPFSTAVAEEFGRNTGFKTPIVEGIGTGGGLKLFCSGVGSNTPDIANASRPIKTTEVQNCKSNGVSDIVEIKIGHDGIVLANSKAAPQFRLTLQQIYLALAARVPDLAGGTDFVPNPYRKWSQIDPALPDYDIAVLGPPPTSGTRDAFNETVLEQGCDMYAAARALRETDPQRHRAVCHAIREDGMYIESGENDNLIVQKLLANEQAVGIFAFSFLDQNADTLQATHVSRDGESFFEPSFDGIANGDYPIFRSLYIYVKKAHVRSVPGIQDFLTEFTSEQAVGEFGYLTDRGLIPLMEEEREYYQRVAAELTALSRPAL